VPIWYSIAAGVGGLGLLFAGIFGVRRNRHRSGRAAPPTASA
jgi:hypothetical protein